MRKFYFHSFTLLLIISSFSLDAQNNFFADQAESAIQRTANDRRLIIPEKYRTTSLDIGGMRAFLWSLPEERNLASRNTAPIMELPMPNGAMARFRVWESAIMEPALSAKYPEIKTFAGQGIDDPYASVRFDFNPYFGFSAQILSVNGEVYIDPYARGNINYYTSYYTRDYRKQAHEFVCNTPDDPGTGARVMAGPCRGTQLYTYRLALACTGEYAVAVCAPNAPTVPATLAAMTTSVNRVSGVYELDLAVRLILIANTDLLIYLDGTSDPYTNNSGGTMLGQNQTNITNVIGSANYDIGHVFSTGGGGVAGLGVVCNNSNKARGVTGLSNPVGDNFDIDYVAHEMGHQFGGNHTFNSITSSCNGNRVGSRAYEVGSGTTIMAYAGICGSDNTQPHSDPFFHTISFDEISNFLEAGGSSCKVVINTGNTIPQITAMNNNGVNIPLNTPFTLTASATDADGDAITYCWEEWDLGPAGAWNSGANSTTAPLFKSRVPLTTGSRTFPDINVILAGYPANPPSVMGGLKGETLPLVGRAMKFRLTVRDNRAGGGGVATGGDGCQAAFNSFFQVNTIDGTGPFVVTAPNGGESWAGSSSQTITWNVAGTNTAPISVPDVKISLSADGGLTYPTVLIASTPNDGSEILTMPAITTTTARIKIEAVGNIFFDISNANFTITVPVASFDFNSPAPAIVACDGPTTADINLGTTSSGGYNTPINLSASNVPAGTSISFGTNPVTPGSSSLVTLNNVNTLVEGTYDITITGVSGAITKTRVLAYVVLPGAGPAISVPPSAQTVCAGSNAIFSVVSPGALFYQWETSPDCTTWSPVPGATSSTLTLNGVTATANGNSYRCVVTGQCGQTITPCAVLTVNTAPSVPAHPQNLTVCSASPASFAVTASGSGLTYQWELSTDGGANYNPVGGATSSTYNIGSTTAAMNNNRYRVVVSGTCTPPAVSDAALLTVITPVAVTTQPADITICETGNVSFTAVGSGAGVLYQWQLSTDGGVNYTNINGAISATLNLNAVTASMNNNRYRVLLSNATCTAPTSSNGAVLTVNDRPTVNLTASPYTKLFPGLTTTLSAGIVPLATGFDISWYRNGTLVPGVTASTHTIGVTGLGDYRVDIINTVTGCNNQSNVLRISDSVSSRLFIFPSPNDGQFTVAYYNSGGGNTQRTITVYDAQGRRMYQAKFAITGPYHLLPINIQPAARGIYMVVVGDSKGKKLVEGKLAVYY